MMTSVHGRRGLRAGKWLSAPIAAGIVVLTLLVSACGSSSSSGAKSSEGRPPLKLYGVFGLTGPQATVAGELLASLKSAIQTINSHGGILDRQIELSYDNDEFDPTKAVSLVQDRIAKSKPDLIFGGTSSGEILPVSQVTNPAKIFTISVGSSPTIGDATKFPYTFSPLPSQESSATSLADYFTSKNYKSVAIIATSDATGTSYTSAYKAAFAKANLNVVDTEAFDSTALDMTTQFQRMKSKSPDVVVMVGTSAGAPLAKSRELAGMTNVPTVADAGTNSANWVPNVSVSALQGMTMQVHKVNVSSSSSNKGISALRASLAAAGVVPKVPLNVYAYASDMLIAYANAANSLKSLDPDKIRTALETGNYTKTLPTALTTDFQWTPTFHINSGSDVFTFIPPTATKDGQYPV